jgi:hypothetical protein
MEHICDLLKQITKSGNDFGRREILVWQLFAACKEAGFRCSIELNRPDFIMGLDDKRFITVLIELPYSGQVSWIFYDLDNLKFDGHSYDTNDERCRAFLDKTMHQ